MARGSKNSDYFEKLEDGKYLNKKTGAIGELKVGRGGGFYIAGDTGSTSKEDYEMARPNETKLFRMIDDGILDEEDVNKMALKYNGVDEIKDAMRVLDYDTSKYTDIDSIYNDGDLDDYDLSRIGQELLAGMPDDDIADMMRANDIVEYGDEEYTPEEEFDTQESRDNAIDDFLDKYPRWEDGDYDEDDYDELSANLGLSRDDTIDEIYSRIQRKAYDRNKKVENDVDSKLNKSEKNKENDGTELQEELYKASQETIRRSKANQKALEEGKHPYVLELAKFINDRNDDLTDEEFGALYKALEVLRKRNQKK